jgi:hypothetical protein
MTVAPKHLGQDPRYGPFLYAPVGEDRRGASVTVLSMLARLGLDPWGEASSLAGMQDGVAQQRLAALMARFTDVSSSGPALDQAVSRLVACLPRSPVAVPASGPAPPSARGVATLLFWLVAIVLLLAFVGMRANGS